MSCVNSAHSVSSHTPTETIILLWHHQKTVCYHCVSQHQAAAFLNMRSQGEGVRECLKSLGAQGHCQPKVQRSGWGIMARCLPSLEQSPAMPCGEPLGFRGYSSVGWPWSSRYRRGASPPEIIWSWAWELRNCIRPVKERGSGKINIKQSCWLQNMLTCDCQQNEALLCKLKCFTNSNVFVLSYDSLLHSHP